MFKKFINVFKQKPYAFLSFYWFLQITWYAVITKISVFGQEYIPVEFTALDKLIPFCEIFILPYVLWYVYILVENVYMINRCTKSEYLYLAIMTIAGMLICMVGNTLFPTELVREENLLQNLGRDNMLIRLTGLVYAADSPPRIVFPSMHVYGSVVLAAAMLRSNVKRLYKICSTVLSVLICLATVFIKQHSVTDMFGALILFAVLHTVYEIILKAKKREPLT